MPQSDSDSGDELLASSAKTARIASVMDFYRRVTYVMAQKKIRLMRAAFAITLCVLVPKIAADALWGVILDCHSPAGLFYIIPDVTSLHNYAMVEFTIVTIIAFSSPWVFTNFLVPLPYMFLPISAATILSLSLVLILPLTDFIVGTLYIFHHIFDSFLACGWIAFYVYAESGRRGISISLFFLMYALTNAFASLLVVPVGDPEYGDCSWGPVAIGCILLNMVAVPAYMLLVPCAHPDNHALVGVPNVMGCRMYGHRLKCFLLYLFRKPYNFLLLVDVTFVGFTFITVLDYQFELFIEKWGPSVSSILYGSTSAAFIVGVITAGGTCDFLGSENFPKLLSFSVLLNLLFIPLGLMAYVVDNRLELQVGLLSAAMFVGSMLIATVPMMLTSALNVNLDGDIIAIIAVLIYGSLALGGAILLYWSIFFLTLILKETFHVIIALYVISFLASGLLLVALLLFKFMEKLDEKKGTRLSELLEREHGDEQQGSKSFEEVARKVREESWYVSASQIHVKKQIGTGSFGAVYEAEWNGIAIAVKTLHGILDEEAITDGFMREVSTLARLRHPNVLTFYGASVEANGSTCIVTEYCSGGCLFDILRDVTYVMSGADTQRFALEITRGVSYLHSLEPPILHRDLKSLNILLDERQTVKLCDFGESRSAGKEARTMTMVGTPMWTAPEVLLGVPYGLPADIYSLGIIFVELITRSDPWPTGMWPAQVVAAVVEGKRPVLTQSTHPVLVQLIQACWSVDPTLRPSAVQIIAQIESNQADCWEMAPTFHQRTSSVLAS